jgi:Spo0E like sporulation regulatory protein.
MRNLLIELEDLRRKMVHLGMRKGLRHPEVLKVSQELDIVLNEYMLAKLSQ